jgi:hypothetical protein
MKTRFIVIKTISMISFLFSLLFVQQVWAKRTEYTIELKDHLFFPAAIEIPPNQKVKLIIHNRDSTPEEFDSFDLNREKVIFPNKKAVIFIGPLPEGRYEFFGEFNPNSAKGTIVVTSKLRLNKPVKAYVKTKTKTEGA